MSAANPSMAELLHRVQGTNAEALVDYLFAQDHPSRLRAVRKAFDFVCNELEMNKHLKQGLGEDAITTDLCSMLKAAGFPACRDKYVNGHCDISIEGDDKFLWLAEAKEHSHYGWLDKGFKQLTTRYSTGVPGQDRGDISIYCYIADAKKMLNKWKEELVSRNGDVVTVGPDDAEPLAFYSTHKHAASGLDFHVRHKAIVLFDGPKDK